MLPARTAVLNHICKVGEASINEIMEALKPEYGHEKQFNKTLYLDHVLSLEANGLIAMSTYSLDEKNELDLSYKIVDDGRSAVEKYVPKQYR